MIRDFEKKYYNQSDLWNKDLLQDPYDRQRVQEIIDFIPFGTENILDVGCGNGAFVNSVFKNFKRVIGLDLSKKALSHVKSEKVLASITDIPFADESFDLVVCSEVLEHIRSGQEYIKAVEELERVSKKYIILTVPNNENLKRGSGLCPQCAKWFHPAFHFGNFTKKKLRNIFNSFCLEEIKEIGQKYPYCPCFLVNILRTFEKPRPSGVSICPFCGYQGNSDPEEQRSKNLISLAKNIIRPILPKRPYWLFAFYKRKEFQNEFSSII